MVCVGVIDVETTGLNPNRHDRIVELATLIIRPDGTILREFVTLLNPDRDIGPTHLHGISARDIATAPRFGEIAGALIEVLNGCVALGGHNVRFDQSFLSAEFARLGHWFPDAPTICTMRLTGGDSLSCACSDFGIAIEGDAHTARHDAIATARLLAAILRDTPHLTSKLLVQQPIVWPNIPCSSLKPLTREDARALGSQPPNYLRRLLARVQLDSPPHEDDSAVAVYSDLLTRALEDRYVDEKEGQALVDLATRLNISTNQLQKINSGYLLHLAMAALSDGVVTETERRDLQNVAFMLGIDVCGLNEIMDTAAQRLADRQEQSSRAFGIGNGEKLAGKRVCFTGECQCLLVGEAISREMATELAVKREMIVVESVTKQLDFLVVADPLTQSGKAKKARRYGIRIVHESVFWRMLGIEVG